MNTIDLMEAAQFAQSTLQSTVSRVMQYFHTLRYSKKNEVMYKTDNSPVTNADKEIEQIIRTAISHHYPTHLIIGEEFGANDDKKTQYKQYPYAWIIDPIDGTQAFIHGVPLFTTLLALFDFEAMQPIIGCVSIPIYETIIYAIKDKGIWESQKASLAHKLPEYQEIQNLQSSQLYLSYDWIKVYNKAPKLAKHLFTQKTNIITRTWADAFAYYLLITANAQMVIDPSTHIWDVAAVYPLIKEAKGIICDWQGQDIQWDEFIESNEKDIIACSSQKTLDTILSFL